MTDSDHQRFIDALRAALGYGPLYGSDNVAISRQGTVTHDRRGYGYERYTRLRALADQGCRRCGGSGYYDGERLDMNCPCTGLAPKRSTGGAKPRPFQEGRVPLRWGPG